ncbi:hypothetical protein CLAFUW4_13482 [Fulvia fulva]|uniref:DUF4185 domain-containing protein n=1 Tax=Passalora fulva TaxID=5499 RepID=A0A9Q8PJW3_PASFU|nr:uncharacterized protein CLAFUR5_13335 [Fulvia fulva]UJO23803.1 hypothetical protein CLAFUR5_13335 [Fulvia fulva]WPV21633.1 hypothetical protein CLAFUW4_13482 [Fulvia fulva]
MHPLLLLPALVAQQILAAPTPAQPEHKSIQPKIKSTTLIANVTDPTVSRDSCGSVRIGDRVLWTCRDTLKYDVRLGKTTLPIISNTASWTDLTPGGGPALKIGPVGSGSDGVRPILRMYGDIFDGEGLLDPFFPLQRDQCPEYGVCGDGSRWVTWPDSPPVVLDAEAEVAVGFTVVPNVHLVNLTNINSQTPSHALYKSTYTASSSDRNALPTTELVDGEFFKEDEVAYGRYGNFAKDGYAYLYGQTKSKGTALAKVPLSSIEDRSTYQYFSSNAWTSTPPTTPSTIPNAGAGGQGTFYYSSYLQSHVWIGQQAVSVSADFYMSTAPAHEGPWCEAEKIFSGENGDNAIGAYSLQAHPSLSRDGGMNGIHVSWTQQWREETVGAGYVTPLVWVEFE